MSRNVSVWPLRKAKDSLGTNRKKHQQSLHRYLFLRELMLTHTNIINSIEIALTSVCYDLDEINN